MPQWGGSCIRNVKSLLKTTRVYWTDFTGICTDLTGEKSVGSGEEMRDLCDLVCRILTGYECFCRKPYKIFESFLPTVRLCRV